MSAPQKIRFSQLSQCGDKIRFISKREAHIHAKGFREKIASSAFKRRRVDGRGGKGRLVHFTDREMEPDLVVYRCEWCQGWHFGNAVQL